MTLDGALRRLETRTERLVRMTVLGAPQVLLDNQRDMVAAAREWVDHPPAEIPD